MFSVKLDKLGGYRLFWVLVAIVLIASVSLGQPLKGSGTATINGTLSPGEWANAAQSSVTVNLPGGGTTPATLYVMNDGTNLYLALQIPGSPYHVKTLTFLFDNNNDGHPADGEDAFNVFGLDEAQFTDSYRDVLSCFESDYCTNEDATTDGSTDGDGTVGHDGTATVFEFSHPLNSGDVNDFALSPGQMVGFFFHLRLADEDFSLGETYFPGLNNYGTIEVFGVTPPPAPLLASPTDGSTGIQLNPTLSWIASEGATSYQVQVSTAPDFTTTLFDQAGISATSQELTALAYATTYYWRVNATNSTGTGNWSATWSFTTLIPPPPAPVLASPANNATGVAVNPTLSWSASSTATSYRLQVSTAPDFTTTLFDQAGISGTSQALSNLALATTYYWRVNATNSAGTGVWSETWSFTTRVQTVEELITVLRSAVEAYVANGTLKPNDAKLMLRSLDDAIERINQGKIKQAIDEMEKFIKEVEKYVKRKTLTADQGDALIASANVIIARLNNPAPLASGQSGQAEEVTEAGELAFGFSLSPNYPNPFNPSTTITYEIQDPSDVALKVFNTLGQEVVTLVDRYQSAGKYSVSFEARNLPSGLYVYQLRAGSKIFNRTMVLVK